MNNSSPDNSIRILGATLIHWILLTLTLSLWVYVLKTTSWNPNAVVLALGVIGGGGWLIKFRYQVEQNRSLDRLPNQIVNGIITVLEEIRHPVEGRESQDNSPHVSAYLDVDNDGKKELLVESGTGPHGAKLDIFRLAEGQVILIGSLANETGAGFSCRDFDEDGRIEIRTQDTDATATEPHATAEIDYRWNGISFGEARRRRI